MTARKRQVDQKKISIFSLYSVGNIFQIAISRKGAVKIIPGYERMAPEYNIAAIIIEKQLYLDDMSKSLEKILYKMHIITINNNIACKPYSKF